MKFIFLLLSIVTIKATAQPKIVKQATVYTTTNIIAPEEEDISQVQQGGDRGGFNFRNMMDGETKSVTTIKNDLVKTSLKSETMKATIYRNNITKITHTVFTMMGSTQGMVASDSDQIILSKKRDSMMTERAKTDTTIKRNTKNVDFATTVIYTEEAKKIGGYNCKKALIVTDKILQKDTMIVWYNPEIKFENVSSTGSMSGIPMMRMGGGNNTSFEKVNGFVMMYERKMPRGRVMEVKVTKIELEKDIADKEFELPKDVDFKNAKDMINAGGPGGMRVFGR